MSSIRTKWLFAGAAIAPVSLFGIFGLLFYTQGLLKAQQIDPQQAVQRMLPYGPILIKLFIAGCLFSVAAIISLIFDNRRKRPQQ
jgi:hypothetical protein